MRTIHHVHVRGCNTLLLKYTFRGEARLWHTQVMGGRVGRRLSRQDHQLGRGVLRQRQDRLQRAWHGCRKTRQILVQGCMAYTRFIKKGSLDMYAHHIPLYVGNY